jgi:hypothetical protein
VSTRRGERSARAAQKRRMHCARKRSIASKPGWASLTMDLDILQVAARQLMRPTPIV